MLDSSAVLKCSTTLLHDDGIGVGVQRGGSCCSPSIRDILRMYVVRLLGRTRITYADPMEEPTTLRDPANNGQGISSSKYTGPTIHLNLVIDVRVKVVTFISHVRWQSGESGAENGWNRSGSGVLIQCVNA